LQQNTNKIPSNNKKKNMSRPEHIAPPDLFYNEEEAKKYGYKYV
jgi:hypothetical protein